MATKGPKKIRAGVGGKRPGLQYVWPRDPRISGAKTGFFGRLGDIMTGKGPDVFLAKKGDNTKVSQDRWGNWSEILSNYWIAKKAN